MEYIIIALLGISILFNIITILKTAKDKTWYSEYSDKNQKSTLDFLERQRNDQVQSEQTVRQMEATRFNEFTSSILNTIETLRKTVVDMSKGIDERLMNFQTQNDTKFNEFSKNTQNTIETLRRTIVDMSKGIDERLANFQTQNDTKLTEMRQTIEQKVTTMQESNEKKLDEMRATVDEKLQKTLEDRISQSFKLVSDRLQQVYEGLGEMKNLAVGVGDLKKVLSNVKTRGVLGEVQLAAILEQILNSTQYDTNVATKKGSQERVEFAVKLPGENGNHVYLPIDAKFPMDAYQDLLTAYDTADAKKVEDCAKILTTRIKGFAKDIKTKYIDVPNTTDFAIMFLPIEGLYAEVVRRGMVEVLQNEYKINIAGPTTMAALLSSLQMGFKTLAIQQRSGEVWEILGGIKQEFDKFEGVLTQAQKRMTQVSGDLENLIGTRTRAIQKKLKNVATGQIESNDEYIAEITKESIDI